jgi:hypothetical protein
MKSLATVKRALRDKYAWPGGYPLYLVTSDGEALSIDAARENWREIVRAHLQNDKRCGWHIAGVDVNWENPDLYCAHTGERIESAYCEEQE